MPDPRRVVIDTSAIVPAFFPDGVQRRDLRARRLLGLIQNRAVVAFAPEMLQAEFLGRSVRRLEQLAARSSDLDRDSALAAVESQWTRFLQARIVYTPASELAAIAWDATARHHVPPPDSWFLACALFHDAELWISHEQADRAGDWSRRYGARVHYLDTSDPAG